MAVAIFFNSCSNTHGITRSASTNPIIGPGIGGQASYAYSKTTATNPSSVQANPTADAEANAGIEAQVDASMNASPQTVASLTPGQKMALKLNKFMMKEAGVTSYKDIAARANQMQNQKGFLSFRERLMGKVYNKMMGKYMARSGGGGLANASFALSISSIVAGGLALLTFYGGFFFGVAAIVLGALALIGIRNGGDGRRGLAIAGIAMGAAAIVLWFLIIGLFVAPWF